jgi:hypothetical protein
MMTDRMASRAFDLMYVEHRNLDPKAIGRVDARSIALSQETSP